MYTQSSNMSSLWRARRLQQEYSKIERALDNGIYAHTLCKTDSDTKVSIEIDDKKIVENYTDALEIIQSLLQETSQTGIISTPKHTILEKTNTSRSDLTQLENKLRHSITEKTALDEKSYKILEQLHSEARKKRDISVCANV